MTQSYKTPSKISFACTRSARLVAACRLLLPCAFSFLLPGCAKTGDPHPPAILVPMPAKDLLARQYSDQVLLAVSPPAQNTNGSPVTTLGTIEIWRRTEDRISAAAAWSEADFIKRAEKILSIPADRLAGFRRDRVLVFRDELSLADRSQIYSKSFLYAVRFVNKKKQSAGLSNPSLVAPVPIPAAPGKLAADVTQDFIRLKWDPPAENLDGSVPPRIAGYNIYRSEDPGSFPDAPLNQEPVLPPQFEDRNFEFDRTYHYAVSIVGTRDAPPAESLTSVLLEVTPRDTFPPGAPQNLNAVVAGTAVLLLWAAPPERDVAGYRIYRREPGEPAARLLVQELVKSPSYRDENIRQDRKYGYRVAAVDTHGNEGPAAEAEVEVR